MQLRPYQSELIENVKRSIRNGNKAVCVVAGCGSGKSVVAGSIAKSATDKGNKVLFLVHRSELCDQIRATFQSIDVNMELCDVCMIQTVRRRLKKMPEYQLIIVDEAHTNYTAYQAVFARYPDVIKIGFTATPVRLSDGGLGKLFTDIVKSVSTKWLISNGYLSPYKYYSLPMADTSNLHIQAGEYKKDEVNALMENSAIYSGAVEQYKRFANGKKTMIYCPSIKSSIETIKAFNDAGISAAHIDGNTPKAHRDRVIEKYRSGEIKVLSNVAILNEGFDDKDIECVMLLRPTMSLALFVQMAMRSMRPKEGKTAIILDCVGSVYKHGLPDDDREWSLEPKHVQETTVKIRECPNCYAVYPPTLNKCPYCGAEAVHEVRTVNRKTVDVDLVEVARQEKIKNTRLADAEFHSWEEIVEFQKLHHYKFMWCMRTAVARGIAYPKKYRYMAAKFLGSKAVTKINGGMRNENS